MLVVELSARRNRVEARETRARSVAHRDRHRVVHVDDRRRRGLREHLVERNDLVPIGVLRARSTRVHRGDRRLQRVRMPRRAEADRALHFLHSAHRLIAVPQRSILILEQHDVAIRIDARRATRVGQEHERA
jgi:hypothetical protein